MVNSDGAVGETSFRCWEELDQGGVDGLWSETCLESFRGSCASMCPHPKHLQSPLAFSAAFGNLRPNESPLFVPCGKAEEALANTILLVGLVYILSLAAMDYHTPLGMSFTLFYFFGIAFVAWVPVLGTPPCFRLWLRPPFLASNGRCFGP